MTITFRKKGQTCICIFLESPVWLHHGFGSGKIHKDWIYFGQRLLTADWSLSGHPIWSPDMWLRVAHDGVDEVDNDQTQPWHRSYRASSQSTQGSDHTYHLDSALFLIEIICQFRHQVPD